MQRRKINIFINNIKFYKKKNIKIMFKIRHINLYGMRQNDI